MGSCFGHITSFQGSSSRNPVIHMSTFNPRTDEVELKFLLAESQYAEGATLQDLIKWSPFHETAQKFGRKEVTFQVADINFTVGLSGGKENANFPGQIEQRKRFFINLFHYCFDSGISARSILSWEQLKASRKKLQKMVLRQNETIDLRHLKPETTHSKDMILTLDAKQLLKMKSGVLTNHYLALDSPPSSLDLEWENEGLSATSCVQSDYATTLATISSNDLSSDPSDRSSIESLEWDLCMNHYSNTSYDGKCRMTQLQDFSVQTLKESNKER